MFNIISRFYVIYGDDNPIYVGYTNRTVKQRFKEHLNDKDFSDYEKVQVKELKNEKLTFKFTWDYSKTCDNADKVSVREGELVGLYNTQDSAFQKALGGGQTWSSEKHFVKANKDNPKFAGMSTEDIKRYLDAHKTREVWLSSFVISMKPQKEQWLSDFVGDMRPQKEVWLSNFVNDMKPQKEVWLSSFVSNMQPQKEVWLSHFVSHMKPQKEVWLSNFVSNMQPHKKVWLSNFVSHMQPQKEIWLSDFVGNMKTYKEIWLSNFVNDMKPQKEVWLHNFITNMNLHKSIDN